MLRLRKPAPEAIRRFLDDQRRLSLTYASVGATATTAPIGYVVDHTRIELGKGERTFLDAKAAITRWQQFGLGWLGTWPAETPIQTDETIAIVAHAAGLWWLNACRIVYVIEETGSTHRFGFAYGTLPDHAASGEERFLVEWNQDSGDVWYDIFAFSRPRHFLAKLGYLFVRRTQERFRRDSAAAMKRAVCQNSLPT